MRRNFIAWCPVRYAKCGHCQNAPPSVPNRGALETTHGHRPSMADGGVQAFDAPAPTTTVSVGDGAITDSARQVVMANNPLFRRCFKRKPLEVVHAEEEEGVLERTLGFWDLFALGFGGTVGRFESSSMLLIEASVELDRNRDTDVDQDNKRTVRMPKCVGTKGWQPADPR